MRKAIEDKLHRELTTRSPISERRVVYILVEVRKLLELQGELNKYPTLRFWCDWALHTNMSRAGAQEILHSFDDVDQYVCDGQPLPESLNERIYNVIRLDQFRRELEIFLSDYGFPNTIIQRRWTAFIHSYAGVIEDCPLTVTGTKLRHIKSVTLVKLDARPHLRKRCPPYLLRWVCRRKDDMRGSFELQTSIP